MGGGADPQRVAGDERRRWNETAARLRAQRVTVATYAWPDEALRAAARVAAFFGCPSTQILTIWLHDMHQPWPDPPEDT